MCRYIDVGTARQHLMTRLYESAINNIGVKCEADDVFTDIYENRLTVWLDEIPSADVVEVRHGKWIELPPFKGIYTCSLCGQWGEYHWGYCPYCGAKMDLEGDVE